MINADSDGTLKSTRSRTEDCNTHNCPYWAAWSPVGSCSSSCDGGTQQYSSTCMYMQTPSDVCNGMF